MRFYTLGLPRTRSMWLSFLFRTGGVNCVHEGLSQGMPVPEEWILGGSVDTNPMLEFDYGDAPVLIVRREPSAVVSSLVRQFGLPVTTAVKGVDILQEALNAREFENCKGIRYQDLSDNDAVKEACDFLVPDAVALDVIEYMQEISVQTRNRDLSKTWGKEFVEGLCA